MHTNWFIDPTQASGQLLENKGPSFLSGSYPFNAFYLLMDGLVENISNKAFMPLGKPTLLHLTHDENNKAKKDSYRFQNPSNGQKLKFELDELIAWCAPFEGVVLPLPLKDLLPNSNQQLFIELEPNKIEKQLSIISDYDGIALKISETFSIKNLLSFIENHPKRHCYVYGDIGISDYKILKGLPNLSIQSNDPLQSAMDGLVYTLDQIIDIKEESFKLDQAPIEANCECSTCRDHSLSYLHHLYSNTPILTIQLMARHNLYHWLQF